MTTNIETRRYPISMSNKLSGTLFDSITKKYNLCGLLRVFFL